MEIKNNHLTRELIGEISRARDEPRWLLDRRFAAFNKLNQLPPPQFKYGISIILKPELDFSKLNFNVKSDSMKNALETHESLIKRHLLTTPLTNQLDALNAAFFSRGNIIVTNKQQQLDTTADRVHVSRSLLIAEDNVHTEVIHKTTSADNIYHHDVWEIIVGKNATLNVADIQTLPHSSFNITTKHGTVERDSTLNWLSCCLGSAFTKDVILTELNGQGASTNNYGFFFGSKKQQFDISTTARHNAPHTVCDMATRGVVNEHAKAIYQGLVRIEKNAPHSNGYQKEDVLILSDTAEADSIPQLEIENNDVRCTHGASIGQIDTEKLFYLMSRGLDEEQAKRKIVEGFFEPMINKIHLPALQNDVRNIILKRMHQ